MSFFSGKFDCIVLGAGHAGCEAALSCARMGLKTLCLTMNLSSVALMACNPCIGGTSKGHLVREIDALGGEMGLAADDCTLQMRMLNLTKGPAVHSPRAQVDKNAYHIRMKNALESTEGLVLTEGECVRILTDGGRISGIVCADGAHYECRAVIVACGVYLKSRVLVGDYARESGPCGLLGANALSTSLIELGLTLRRFKTGTPPRINGRTVDFSRMELQPGDVPTHVFSFLHKPTEFEQTPCYLTYTNASTHDIILNNISRSAMYSGLINAVGTRYCPSIEDKLMRFPDKERHQIFIEPEGRNTDEMYVQGLSTSLPADCQRDMLHTIKGLEHCSVMRYGYAIEYDCLDPLALSPILNVKGIDGLFTAGQINGTSGYEEAAAQGLVAGINAALKLQGREPMILSRADAYIGVLVDDLTTKGTNEPYRMMTSRSEYRLLHRQDNADKRLCGIGLRIGLISQERYDSVQEKYAEVEREIKRLEKTHIAPSAELNAYLEDNGTAAVVSGASLADLIRRPQLSYEGLRPFDPERPALPRPVWYQAEISLKYEGYIKRQLKQVEDFASMENRLLPDDIDYDDVTGLRLEAREKLKKIRPHSFGQASRISGVSPADISVLMVWMEGRR